MRRSAFLIATMLFVNAAAASSQVPTVRYVMNRDDGREWCVYSSERSWKIAIDSASSDLFAKIRYSGGRLVSVQLTSQDTPGAGDWVIYDTYSFGHDERPVSLHRITNILPGDYSREEWYRITLGVASLTRTRNRQLSTLKETSAVPPWLPESRIVVRLRDFPFARALQAAPRAGRHLPVCVQ